MSNDACHTPVKNSIQKYLLRVETYFLLWTQRLPLHGDYIPEAIHVERGLGETRNCFDSISDLISYEKTHRMDPQN